jgi:glutathione S-transferase
MKLYYCETMNPRKACATAKYLDLPIEYVRVDLAKGEHQSAEYLALNPNGKLPLLVDGDTIVWEAIAIMAHLASRAGSPLWPREPAQQVEVIRWLSWDLCHWVPHAAVYYFEHSIKPRLIGERPDRAALELAKPLLLGSARILDAHLARHAYLTGEQLTIADFSLGVLLPHSREIELPLADFANIQRWHGELMKLEAWRNPWPS